VQKAIYNYLSQYYHDAELVDRLIISAFMQVNELEPIQNILLNNYSIQPESDEALVLNGFLEVIRQSETQLNFEHLIELFEFVVSPSDKIVNGAVYTPKNIRSYIVDRSVRLEQAARPGYKLADIACGCGGFLLAATEKIRDITGRSYEEIYQNNIYGVDITPYSINRTRALLTLYAVYHGEDRETFNFNLFTGNSLDFDWAKQIGQPDFNGFQCIVGNPPYVASRNMDESTLELLKRWSVAGSGHPDLYIPFFQIGFVSLAADGILGLITVNTFIKSVNGRALRQYFEDEQIGLEIINFGGEQVFRDRNTYTCICFLQKIQSGIRYIRCESSEIEDLNNNDFTPFAYGSLNHKDGWNLVNSQAVGGTLAQIEAVGLPFKQLYNTKNGIATLKNHIYKFTPISEDKDYYYLTAKPDGDKVEKSICRDIVNANKLKNGDDLVHKLEKIIFPYVVNDGKVTLIDEPTMVKSYPETYRYLQLHKILLGKRDKSKKTYEAWYAYGRRQSMDIKGYKLFFPHICERPRFVISEDTDLLFYNGIAVVSEDLQKLLVLKKLLESDLFYFYIKNTTKDYASGYISLSRNYLKNFGVYQFNEEEKLKFLSTVDSEEFLRCKYKLTTFKGL
jgi:methylase of polypeptide subunit release factors